IFCLSRNSHTWMFVRAVAFVPVVSILSRMSFSFVLRAALLAWISIFAGCGTVHETKTTEESPPSETPADLEQRADAHAHYLAGLSFEQNREIESALAEYEKALIGDPANEDLAVELSRRYLQRKEYDKAIEVLKKAAEVPEASGLMFARLSLIYLQQGKTNAAVEASRTAIKRQPSSIAGYQSLFHLHRALGQTNEARKAVEQAAKQPKPDAPFLIDLAHLYLALDAESLALTNSPTRTRAREMLKRAASMESTNIVALQRLAQGFMFVGETKRAADVYLKMLQEDPDLMGVRESLAELYLRDNDSKRAAEQLKEIIRDSPTNPQAYFFLGAIAYEERRFADALDNYRKALLLGMDTQQIYFDIAVTQLALQKPRDALDYLEKARRKFRRSFLGEFYSGLCYMRLKEYTNALDHFTAAELVAKTTETNRLNHMFYFELGSAHERAGKIPEAEKYFEQCLSMSNSFAPALNYLGYMWAERGTNLTRARTMIEHAVKLDPTNAAYLDSLGWVLFKQGHTKEALDPIRKAVELNDEPDATLFDHLGDVYSALKQPEKAREAWRKSLQIEPNREVEKKLKQPDPPPGARTSQ
ncbi:MAG TPA: tetratricopeptide repeat protein, partial [Candidatus Limnocylindria bacterium]|nr:tetratricopeptide repeat protein [Candidatus Limnocylindria bacterium]